VAEHGGDRFQAHAPVDRLGGQRVAQLVGVDVWQAGGCSGPVDMAGDRVTIELCAVFPRQLKGIVRCDVAGAVVVDELNEVWMQRQVAVLAQLADRDVQPRPAADLHDRIRAQGGVFADA
jgi:hypothetical protein